MKGESSSAFSHSKARTFYDRFGSKQDWQRFYEKSAVSHLIHHLDLGSAKAIIEFGCGTGWLAENLMAQYLSPESRYVGLDISTTMVKLARNRLRQFGRRAEVVLTEGEMRLNVESNSFDRFLSAYVMDLLSEEDMQSILAEAHRVLIMNGLLGIVSLTEGFSLSTRILEKIWAALYRLSPTLVGGCRPVSPEAFVKTGWDILYLKKTSTFAVPSSVLVARKV